MTPAQHATTAAAEVAFTSPIYVEVELAALRAQGHAVRPVPPRRRSGR